MTTAWVKLDSAEPVPFWIFRDVALLLILFGWLLARRSKRLAAVVVSTVVLLMAAVYLWTAGIGAQSERMQLITAIVAVALGAIGLAVFVGVIIAVIYVLKFTPAKAKTGFWATPALPKWLSFLINR